MAGGLVALGQHAQPVEGVSIIVQMLFMVAVAVGAAFVGGGILGGLGALIYNAISVFLGGLRIELTDCK